MQTTRYGGFDSDGYFVTARIPPSYQNCTQEGRLSGCLVMDDDLDQQCNQGRTGKVTHPSVYDVFKYFIVTTIYFEVNMQCNTNAFL